MAAYELSKEWIKKNNKKLKEAYNVAKASSYDITSNEDMLQLLEIIDPVNATEENALLLSKLLKLFSYSLKSKIKKRYIQNKKVKERIIN